MRSRRRHPVLLLTALAVWGCDAGLSDPDPTLGPAAELYLIAALDIMETKSVRRYEIDWPEFRETTRSAAEAAGAQNAADTHPMLVDALARIGDNHSFFVPAGSPFRVSGPSMDLRPTPTSPASVDPSAQRIAPGIGYVDVPAFSGGGPAGDSVADEYHRLIESVDTLEAMCRWVVDVRGNTGGNMWPMIAGIGPILGEGSIGFFVDPDSLINVWYYEEGRAGIDAGFIARAETPYVLRSPLPNVAVLTDSLTASSGEAVAVAFRGRAGARSFGEATWGVSTANEGFQLSDGSLMFLTTTTMADRTGMVYGRELPPDEVISGGMKTGDPQSDPVLDAAIQWLNAQACS